MVRVTGPDVEPLLPPPLLHAVASRAAAAVAANTFQCLTAVSFHLCLEISVSPRGRGRKAGPFRTARRRAPRTGGAPSSGPAGSPGRILRVPAVRDRGRARASRAGGGRAAGTSRPGAGPVPRRARPA